ncbi:MAG TPA: hypothetical protein VFU62_08600 [Hanamia sp.]|jgi:hypothetical protein|nr:hypothetical protein [Hanamia sp.]
MKHFFKQYALITLLLFLFTECNKDSPTDALSDLYLPDFSNQWTEVKGPNLSSFFFINSTVTDSSKATGTLEGEEENGTDNFKLKGTFQSINVKLQYLTNAENGGNDNGPHAGFSYSGKVDTLRKPILLRLVNVNDKNDSLVLRHG